LAKLFTPQLRQENMKKKKRTNAEQVIRPTGLIDPELIVRPVIEKGSYKGQIFDFIEEAEKLLKKAAELLLQHLPKNGRRFE
jgi:excinuclease UvrABC helicase subunit UvrB